MQSKSIKYPEATKSGQIGLCKPLLDMFPCTFVVLSLITTIFLLLAYGLVQWFDGSFMIGVNKDGYWVPYIGYVNLLYDAPKVKQHKWYFSLLIPLKKCEKTKKIQEKNLKIQERAVLEIFTIFFQNFPFFTLF